jgi:ATP-binding protein involved in chromosome partitioning
MSRIAVPLANGSFTSHFGGAEEFELFDFDEISGSITGRTVAAPPPHERGVFPVWLRNQGVTTILAGGMGPRAVQILQGFGIETVLGVEGGEPEQLVRAFLNGSLVASGEGCGGGRLLGCGDHGDH